MVLIMSLQTRWLIENQVLLQTFSGALTLEDLSEANQTAYQLIYQNEQVSKVYLLIDARHVTSFPKNLSKIMAMISETNASKTTWTLVLVEESVISFLSTMLADLFRFRLRTFTNAQTLLAFLRKQDESLGDIQLPEAVTL